MSLRIVALIVFGALVGPVATAADAPPAAPVPTLHVADATTPGSHGSIELKIDPVMPNDTTTVPGTADDVAPLWPDEVADVTDLDAVPDGRTRFSVGGAVAASVARVEITAAPGYTFSLPTTVRDVYHGRFAGRLRFFAGSLDLPSNVEAPQGIRTRMFDADGTLLGDVGAAMVDHTTTLRQRRMGAVHVAATLESETATEAQALAPGYRGTSECASASASVGGHGGALANPIVCRADEREHPALQAGVFAGCARVAPVVAAFAPRVTRTLQIALGDGRTVRVAPRRVFGRDALAVAILPLGRAVRAVAALDGARHVLARQVLHVPPSTGRCAKRGGDFYPDALPRRTPEPSLGPQRAGSFPDAAVASSDAGRRLLVRESGHLFCVDVDALAADGRDCDVPPLDSREARLEVDRRSAGTDVAFAMLAAPAGSLQLRLRDGSTVALPARRATGYAGRYRDALRFALATLPDARRPVGGTVLDELGRPVGHVKIGGDADEPQASRSHTVLRADGLRLRARRSAPRGSNGVCLSLGDGPCFDHNRVRRPDVNAVVSCRRRQTIVYGFAPSQTSRPELELASGGRRRIGLHRLPPALGTTGRVYLATAGRGERVVGLRVRRHRRGRVRFTRLPFTAPRVQCGYSYGHTL